ncbi:MAG: Crp/Fnr family transcriptional regulator [Eggerthellaceae bacterium]|nr:Crp/Fnr family transcriptional regulator [Eggerthellaceae bacterium]
MNCSTNAFCSSLTPELRAELCKHCRRRLVKAGSIQIYEDFERRASLLIDGIVLISGHVGEDVVGYSDDVPTCYLGVPGRMLSTNVTFREGGGTEAYGYNSMEYLTDCCVAHFDHDVIRKLFENHVPFAHAMVLSALRIMEDGCMMTAILRANSVYLSVFHLVQYLAQQNDYLTQQQIANLINHDRASVSKAMTRIKKEQPATWEAYVANKGRTVTISNPNE